MFAPSAAASVVGVHVRRIAAKHHQLYMHQASRRRFGSDIDTLRLLSEWHGKSGGGFVERGGEKVATAAGPIAEDLENFSEAASTPKMQAPPGLIVSKWDALMSKIGWLKKDGETTYTGVLAPYYRIIEAYRSWRNFVVEPSREKLLPDPLKPPYWQPKYTVVIELKNVLVAPEWSYKTGNRVKKRPALDYFLEVIGYPNFEVVIYTSETAFSAASVVETLDSKQKVMYKLYRDCCKYMNGVYVKDLSKLNRDLSKVIYIDVDPEAFQLNPENVLRLPKWEGT
ncbi:unnamed protein product, partial [Gongylonema pulchrum]|uniref:Mitochondrial import inner membrane translocase subunit TIM50 n=1 Tax=Gongylonema pulchrum TaxID=637853 RepID=A0A183EL95_9BILA